MLRVKTFWALGLALALATSAARADVETFSTAPGAMNGASELVSATVTFTISAGEIDITLSNLTAKTADAGMLLSDLKFAVNNGTLTGTTSDGGTGNEIFVNGDKTVTAGNTGASAKWGYTKTATSAHLDGLGGGNTPADTIIGPADSNGKYNEANPSVAGNGPHNPFIDGTLNFVIKQGTGSITDATTIASVSFSWGTTTGDDVPGYPVPEPSTLAIAGLGALGFIGYGLRRRLKK
jgi:hypothetical protein